MRWRQASRDHAVHHLERRDHARAGIAEPEHHAVAEPLHGPPAVLDRGPFDESRKRLGQLGRRPVTALLCQARVAGDVEEADRRLSLRSLIEPRARQQVLEAIADVRGPRLSLLGVVDREERLLRGADELLGAFGVRDPITALTRVEPRLSDLGSPPLRLCFGNTPCAVADRSQEALDRDGIESQADLDLEERHDPELVLADPVPGQGGAEPGRLTDQPQKRQGDPGSNADLLERLVGQCRHPLVLGLIDEIEREDALVEASGHADERQARLLQRLHEPDPSHVADRQAVIGGMQDSGRDELVDVRDVDAGAGRGFFASQAGHRRPTCRARRRS